MAIIKCENCNYIMIPRKSYYECPICHETKELNAAPTVTEKKDKKIKLINQIKEKNDNEPLLLNFVNQCLEENSSDALAKLLLSYIERNNKPDIFKREIQNYFLCKEEKDNFEEVVKYLVDFSEYKFIVAIDNCVSSTSIYEQVKPYIHNKIELIENEMEHATLIHSDVFVCYSSNDLEYVESIIQVLEDGGIKCWYANRNMPKNHPTDFDYKKNIDKAIQNCKVFLVIASKNSMYSSDVQWEIDKAIECECNKRIEYVISPLKHTPKFRDFFDGLQWIDATNSDEKEVLVERIHYLLSNKDNVNNIVETEEISEVTNNANNVQDESNHNDDIIINEEEIDNSIINQDDSVGVDLNYDIKPQENNEKDLCDKINYKELGIKAFENFDYDEALIHFSNCELDSEINYYLARIYSDINTSNYDIDKAYEYIMNSDDSRLIELANDLGKYYYIGNNINLEKAFNCFKKAADLGNDKAMSNVAVCYSRGKGTNKDLSTAYFYYKKAADAGNIKAMYEYANACLDSSNDIYNPTLGIEYLTKAAKLGHTDSQYSLGVHYYTGTGTNTNYNESLYWLDKAILNGSKEARNYKDAHFNNDVDYNNNNCALELDDLDDLDLY